MDKKTKDAYSTLYKTCRMVLNELENAQKTGVYDLNALKGAIDSFDKESKWVFDACSCASENDSEHHMVDLGLPSGLKWADRNVGAASPQDYGDYFMWGSTTPDTDKPCDWAHAPFNDGSSYFESEYFSANSGTWLNADGTLKPEFDAAHVNMGDGWRMPTYDEIWELIDGTTQSVEELNGIAGMRFTSNTNGNSIFIPFCGYRFGSEVIDAVFCGNVWSSSFYKVCDDGSYYLLFDGNDGVYVDDCGRYNGIAVRGVHD